MADAEKPQTVETLTHGHQYGISAHRATTRTPIANSGSLGLFSFASTTFLLSMYNVGTRGIHTPNVVVGMALFCGGLGQLLAGIWAFPAGNMFAATAFTSYGVFWMSYATILIPGSGVLAAYTSETELESALGIYLMTWMMVTFFLFIVTLRKAIAFIVVFGFLTLTFLVLAISNFTASANVQKAGGALGIITAFCAYYVGLSELLAAEPKRIFSLPLGPL